ncbi:MAG: phosphate acyltransferase PlsX [Defluviitaleaceae bacterium]|nr:phosphate acyltransferase PlsX [Defluviitaleaceae bacterium]
MTTIAIDAMGGDNAPTEIIKGAVDSLQVADSKIILVGKEDIITKELSAYNTKGSVEVVNATEIISTEEAALAIKQKKDSSLVVGLNLLKEGRADSFISAGSTGAFLVGATLKIKRLPGIDRPALGTLLPGAKGFTLMLDSGANVDCKPEYLLQFAVLGSVYMEHVQGIKKPAIGLLNVGTEKDKGNVLTKGAYDLLAASSLNFKGNIEAGDIAKGTVDVAVCDGFAGNVLLKTAEGYSKFIFGTVKKELMATPIRKIGALLSRGAFENIKKSLDHSEVGGAPFLGLESLVIKVHGSSKAKDIVGAVKQSHKFTQNNMIDKLKEGLQGGV